MSSRRSTRASSRASTPSIAEPVPATPRRSARHTPSIASETPLPAIATKYSTAYGSSITELPANINLNEIGGDLGDVVERLSNPPAPSDDIGENVSNPSMSSLPK